jgi:hypothetical protein
MKEMTTVKKITIIDRVGRVSQLPESDILRLKTSASVNQYCGTFHVTLKNDDGKNSKIAEPKTEIEIWAGYAETGINKIMAGYIDEIVIQKKEESGETVEIFGRSYVSLLFDTKVSGKIQFTKGFSQVVRKILNGSPFDLKGIQESEGTGVVFFKNITVVDLIRQLSEDIEWVFRIDYDKVFYFGPTFPSKTHPDAITTKDMKGYKITKR